MAATCLLSDKLQCLLSGFEWSCMRPIVSFSSVPFARILRFCFLTSHLSSELYGFQPTFTAMTFSFSTTSPARYISLTLLL